MLAAASANPILAVGLNVAESLLDIGLKVLKENGDDLWIKRYFTFNYKIDGYDGGAEFESKEAKIKLALFTA